MDVRFVIRQRLAELGLGQKDLAAAAQVTESYISQLLTRKKLPPAPDRTDIYDKMAKFLKLPGGTLSKMADLQRKDELRRNLGDSPTPLFREDSRQQRAALKPQGKYMGTMRGLKPRQRAKVKKIRAEKGIRAAERMAG